MCVKAKLPVREVIKVDMPEPCLPAVKCFITVLAFQVEGLPFMNHLYVLSEV